MNLARKIVFFGLVLVSLLTLGCVATGNYRPPITQNKSDNYSTIIYKSFDSTWSSLIEYSASTFFQIENFEKASGLLTLSFGASDADRYVDCGMFIASSGNRKYNGSYVGYLKKYFEANLQGKMNIFVKELAPNQTLVRVNARYVLSSPPESWVFNSGSSASVRVSSPLRDTDSIRTCRPSYEAETTILRAIESF